MAVTSFENKDKSVWPYFANHTGSKNTNYLALRDGWQLWDEKKKKKTLGMCGSRMKKAVCFNQRQKRPQGLCMNLASYAT